MKGLLLALSLPAFAAAGVPVPQGQPVADYEDLGQAMKCFMPTTPLSGMVVIRDEKTFAQAGGILMGLGSCLGAQLPKIDFTKQTVLGIYAEGGGCKIDFSRYVSRNDAAKRIILYAVVISQGSCRMASMNMNWVAVPLIPENYTVTGSVMSQKQ